MNMGQMLMQGLTANNPMVAQIMQMKNSGMTPQQALQQMAQSNPQMRQIMQGGNPQQAAMNMLKEAGVDLDTRVRDLTDEEVARIREVIDRTQTVEGDLRREIALNIKRLIEIGCYRGIRHRKGLPVRGQKTKTNARTRKGPRKTVANKKK